VNRTGLPYDLIVVDGRDRVNCVDQAIGALSPAGCVVLDDSERSEYAAALDRLAQTGFKHLDFWGVAPGLSYRKCTSLFYREGNCLNI
jgi:hypothetical protein